MGPVSMGSSGPSISELKGLLEVAGDPAKTKQALEELEKKHKDISAIADKSRATESSVVLKLKELEKKEKDIKDSLAMIDKKNLENSKKALELDSKMSEANAMASDLSLKIKQLDSDKAAFDFTSKRKLCDLDVEKAKVDQVIKEGLAVKEEYETKLAKLKSAMG